MEGGRENKIKTKALEIDALTTSTSPDPVLNIYPTGWKGFMKNPPEILETKVSFQRDGMQEESQHYVPVSINYHTLLTN